MSAWPATLPQQLEQDGYSEDLPNGVIRTNMDAGPAKVRKRYTAAVKPVSGQLVLTLTQVGILQAFFEDDCDYGASTFTWVHPSTGVAATCRFTSPPRLSARDGNWVATVSFEVLPDGS
jgi:hypothetical protein